MLKNLNPLTRETIEHASYPIVTLLGFGGSLVKNPGGPIDVAVSVALFLITVGLIVGTIRHLLGRVEDAAARARTEQVIADSEALRKVMDDSRAKWAEEDAARAAGTAGSPSSGANA